MKHLRQVTVIETAFVVLPIPCKRRWTPPLLTRMPSLARPVFGTSAATASSPLSISLTFRTAFWSSTGRLPIPFGTVRASAEPGRGGN